MELCPGITGSRRDVESKITVGKCTRVAIKHDVHFISGYEINNLSFFVIYFHIICFF